MREYKQQIVPAHERTIESKRICDICHQKFPYQPMYEVNETEVRFKWGSNYPEGGWGEEIIIDICPECFKKHLIPFVESHGSKIESKAWDW